MNSHRAAYLLLTLTALFWAGNFVLARAVHNSVPPVGLAFWRWFAVAAFVVPWGLPELRAQWPLMRRHPRLMLILGLLSVGAFNTLIYVGVQTTTAVNALLLISAIPVFILLLAPPLLGNPLLPRQTLGVIISAAGVLLVLSHGRLAAFGSLLQHVGSLWVLAGVFSWALYSVLLRRLPQGIGGRGLFAATVLVGLAVLLPFYLFETFVQHRPVHPSGTLLISVAYLAVFASILAYMFWNKAVGMVGAERAGVFIHLMPAFGLILSATLLGERISPADLGGLALILAGLFVAAGRLPFARRA
ncbi:hypothetical protein BJI67_00995 [Acidihalobacter aeolianus]|uniref:EamA domain-containing protein n=1 Tax=Acidihalobacter aeolianus TaxID=2792603 RepID=A0A1D8K4E2_9GAMM|nr:DMT family transporter [Acidihalobacter aeolianus]AOV15830.1 hypothetical protein BJI67_00995 [Acidihalobacter aeolianus]